MSRRAPWWRDRRTRLILLFVALPVGCFSLPAIFGLPWLSGDNLIQNFPLRVLVGTDLRHGHLPLWDPYLWSGAPLLAGFNAGAAYPLTALFALVPHVLAWVANQVVVEVVAATGMLSLLRHQGRSWSAAGLGSGAFCYGGFMAMQSVHIDLVEAAGWLVWALVAMERIAAAPRDRRSLAWCALLGAALGMTVLTGAAEPILDGGVGLALYGGWAVWRAHGERWALAARLAGSALLGVCVGAAQLVPGSVLQGQSQRAAHTFTYFASGSMNKSLTMLGLDPWVLGGAHSFPLGYIGTYNLPEISSYIGIMPVMAMVGLLARRHRRQAEFRSLRIWYAVGGLALILAWGGFTPLGHLEFLVPLYNRQRLLVRNLIMVDVALAVLFAAWLDMMLFAPRPAATPCGSGSQRRQERGRLRWPWPSDVTLPLIPVAAVLALQVTVLGGGPWLAHFIHVPAPVTWGDLWRLGLMLTVPSALAAIAAWLVVRGPRANTVAFTTLVLAVDLLLFNAMDQTLPELNTAVDPGAGSAQVLAAQIEAAGTGPGGQPHRFAFYDPQRYYSLAADAIGQPDLNILRGLDGVQGYGALVDDAYNSATGSHLQGNVSLTALSDGTLKGLDLGVLVTVPQSFINLVVAAPGVPSSIIGGATAIPPRPPDPSTPANHPMAPATPPRASRVVPAPPSWSPLAAGQSRTEFFGAELALRSVSVPVRALSPGARLRVGLLEPGGVATHWLNGPAGQVVAEGEVEVEAPGTPEATGIVISAQPVAGAVAGAGGGAGGGSAAQPPAVLETGQAVFDTAGQGVYSIDGELAGIITAPHWVYSGSAGDFAIFRSDDASGRAYLSGPGSGSATIRRSAPWGTETIEVHCESEMMLVRDEGYATGWQADISPLPGKHGVNLSVPVLRHGLVQAVRIPAGVHLVTFSYRPHRVDEGLALSALGLLACALLVVRGRRRGGHARPARR